MKQNPSQASAAGRPETSPASFIEIIDAQRTEIGKAMSIVEACRMGSDSMLGPMHSEEDTEPNFEGALAAAWEILNRACTELETIMKQLQRQGEMTP